MSELSATATPRLIRTLTLILLLGLALALGSWLWHEHRLIDNSSRQRALQLVELLDNQTTESFHQIDRVLLAARQLIERTGVADDDRWREQLNTFAAALPQILSIEVSNADNRQLYSSRNPRPPYHALSDEYWFEVHRNAQASNGRYISVPLQSAYSNEWQLVISRRISTENGDFDGVISARIGSGYFYRFHTLLMLGPEDSLSLLHSNGTGFSRYPFSKRIEGKSFAKGKLFTEILPAQPSGVSRPPAKTDGILRLVAHRQLSELPLVVTLGINDSAAFQRWKQLLAVLVGIYLLFAATLLWLCRRLIANTQALEQSRLALEKEKAFETTMFEASSSITFVLRNDGTICRANAAAEQITGRDRSWLVDRPFSDILIPEDGDYFQQWLEAGRPAQPQQLRELQICRDDDQHPVVSLRVETLQTSQLRIVSGIDISERKQAEARIWHQANYDALTGLPNRALLQDRARQAIAATQRNLQPLALLFIDLDHFKQVNDNHGHSSGDQVLAEFAERLQQSVREQDTAARYAGDEFIVLMPALQSPEEVTRICRRLLDSLQRPIATGDRLLSITASIGVCLFPDDADDFETLMIRADDAMYQAKMAGRNCCFRFNSDSSRILHLV